MSQVTPSKDTIGTMKLKELYEMYRTASFNDFRDYCIKMIQGSLSSAEKKRLFIESLMQLKNKDRMLKKVNDFALAGEGLKVIKVYA